MAGDRYTDEQLRAGGLTMPDAQPVPQPTATTAAVEPLNADEIADLEMLAKAATESEEGGNYWAEQNVYFSDNGEKPWWVMGDIIGGEPAQLAECYFKRDAEFYAAANPRVVLRLLATLDAARLRADEAARKIETMRRNWAEFHSCREHPYEDRKRDDCCVGCFAAERQARQQAEADTAVLGHNLIEQIDRAVAAEAALARSEAQRERLRETLKDLAEYKWIDGWWTCDVCHSENQGTPSHAPDCLLAAPAPAQQQTQGG